MSEDKVQEIGEAHGMSQEVIDEVKKEADRVEEKEKESLPGLGHNVGGVAGQRLLSFLERVERLEEEKKAITDDIKEVYAEAKGVGFDVKTMRKIVKLRKMEPEKRREEDELLDLYKSAVGMV